MKSPFPKNKRHHVYLNEDSIFAAIDRANRRAQTLLTQEHCLKNTAFRLFKEVEEARIKLMAFKDAEFGERERGLELKAIEAREESEKCAKAYNRIKEKTLPRLGRALAAMRTETMKPLMEEYRGVSAE